MLKQSNKKSQTSDSIKNIIMFIIYMLERETYQLDENVCSYLVKHSVKTEK